MRTGGRGALRDTGPQRVRFGMDCLENFFDECYCVWVAIRGKSQFEARASTKYISWKSYILSFRKSSRESMAFVLSSDSGVSARIKAIT